MWPAPYFSPTFAHAVSVPLQLAVFHPGNDVKQRKDLLLGQPGAGGHHQAAGQVGATAAGAGAVVHHGVADGLGRRRHVEGVHVQGVAAAAAARVIAPHRHAVVVFRGRGLVARLRQDGPVS